MSTPRGGRGGERGRGTRGSNPFTRGITGRGRGNGAPVQNHTNTERPTQAVYTRGGGPRGGSRGNMAMTRGSTTTRANTRGRGNHAAFNSSTADYAGGPNSTPFAQDDYAKRLEHIKAERPKLRERFIRDGRMNPEGQMRLSDSVKLIGICTDMCPEYERVRRIVEDDVKPPECTPETEHLPRKQRIPDESRMVKAYARSAAGMDVELVSEIRSPATCLKTLDYLMQRLDNDEFDFLHSWIWDRARAIRKDLRTQRIEQRSDINILLTTLERSARFLLLSTHQMARSKKEDYSHQQDIEQLNQTLMSLKERYIDNRRVGYPSENEAEFWAYRLILAPLFTNSQLENELHRLPSDLRNNRRVQTAIEIYRVLKSVIFTRSSSFVQAQANWKRFWELIKSPTVSYLMACAAEVSFQRVRHVVLDTLWRVYRMGTTSKPHTVDTWTTDRVKDVLGLDRATEAVELCEAYGFRFGKSANGHTFLDVSAMGFARSPLKLASDLKPQIFSQGIVEKKRYNRAFSAVVQAMSVQEAKNHGLMANSDYEEMEDETSLFVPEAPAAQFNAFTQPNGNVSNGSNLTPFANPFLPKTSTAPAPDVSASNPFLQAKAPSNKPSSGSVTTSNPFLAAKVPPSQPFSGSTGGGIQPGLFDVTKDSIKFGPSGTATTPFTSLNKPNHFASTSTPTETIPSSTSTNGPAQSFDFSAAATTATPQLHKAPSSTTYTTGGFTFPGFTAGGVKSQSTTPASSFTPAGSPVPVTPTVQDTEKHKAEEEAQRRKAEAESEAQRQRTLQEQARLAREAAERQRIEAEQHRLRLQEEEQNRIIREAREREEREEQARIARLRARESGYDSLTADLMFDAEEGLMMQFVENLVVNVAGEVLAAKEEEKRRKLWEKKQALADALYEQRVLGLKRLVMASWITKVEKKKRVRQARDRRRRLKEQKARMINTEDAILDMPMSAESEVTTDQLGNEAAFRKPQAPASARRAKRTEQRRGTPSHPRDGASDSAPRLEHQAAVQAALTPVSMSSTHISSVDYSEAYQKSNAPIDRTETDYFTMRAEGLDPSRLRKRSFDSSSEEDQPLIEPKRPKMAPSTIEQPSAPLPTTAAERRARLDAIEQRFRKSGGSHQATTGVTSVNGRVSLNGRSSLIIEQARQFLGRSRSQTTQALPPGAQHDWGRSVPNLGLGASSARQSVLGQSVGAVTKKDRPAYWDRPSRFVPKSLYGQGPEAVRAYREKHGLNSPANTRPGSIEPLAMASPIPTQQSYMLSNGYTQEQYSEEEESSGVDVIDVDAEDSDAVTTEEEYEGDEESEEEEGHQHLGHVQSHGVQYHNQEDDSSMQDDEEVEYTDGYVNGQYTEDMLENYEVYSEEDHDEEEEESRAHPVQPPHSGKLAPLQQENKPGNTEDDAIELSD